MLDRPEIIALTKTEGMDDELLGMQMDGVRAVAGENAKVLAISSSAHQGLKEVLRALRTEIDAARALELDATEDDEEEEDLPVISLSQEEISKSWTAEHDKENNVYEVKGDKIEKFARRTNFMSVHGVNRLRDIMRKMGIDHELRRIGAVNNSRIKIGPQIFELVDSDWED
ncbi:MAG: Obg family GTPase CgtA [Candidatus Sacchiramonaceae bacterium]|nr:Obg family GTPase CgtA [Candidatus Saccharimonadaceae bacterium]